MYRANVYRHLQRHGFELGCLFRFKTHSYIIHSKDKRFNEQSPSKHKDAKKYFKTKRHQKKKSYGRFWIRSP